ncbi:aldo/keto reductase [Rhodococcus sp. ACPA4]|uniref:Diketogulonate reductase-like aldo/keto reductase n=1 Tax=Nocardia globerula TaxID=1818 RepID=A0A652YTC6_NOCGL|nr:MULTISPECIES: aldo/keto reductase [Rhodococcus]NMD61109.1 aldo/keto reductase [Nocardia globerula]NRI65017.1 aldo/keto reductase [Rhodococcus sp. MS16]PBC37680.1 aldo/keto reductase [Rhodococcus sp. ACPA4]PVX67337.1 diketogulonate reductase-like aldo/keto reductase [Rhodococcus globerulus]
MLSIPDRTLTHGTTGEPITIPQLGYGVFQVPDEQTEDVTATALDLGYRHIDTASIYGNEAGVGRAIAGSDIPRQELFVTTKLWNDDQGRDRTLAAFDTSLSKLGLDYVDLYLIHWPAPGKGLIAQTWAAFEEILASGRTRAIGVSNFLPEHLDLLAERSSITPAVNQIELHPRLAQHTSRKDAQDRGIEIEAWSPLGQGTILDDPTIVDIAAALGKSPAQVILRWHIEQGHTVLSKTVTPQRMRDNADIFDFALSADQSAAIDALNTDTRVGPDPLELN